ncbi:MAG: nuclear transport factor 2 family protein [Bacteroidota bacterium]
MMSKTVTAVTLPLLIALLMTSQAFANPTNPGKDKKSKLAYDQEEICRTLTYYYEGSNMGVVNAVEGALHPDAQITMLYTDNGKVEAINVNQMIKAVANGQAIHTSNLRLLNLDIEGDAAMAKIRVVNTNTGKRSIRYLHLVRAGNQWRIVNETAYHKG